MRLSHQLASRTDVADRSVSTPSSLQRALVVILACGVVAWAGRAQAQIRTFESSSGFAFRDETSAVRPFLHGGHVRVSTVAFPAPLRVRPSHRRVFRAAPVGLPALDHDTDQPTGAGWPAARERWDEVRREIVSPLFLLRTLGPTTGNHLNDVPEPWRGDVVGYGARLASNTGGALLQLTSMHGLAAVGRLDIRFVPRKQGSVASRVGHAVRSTFVARTREGVLLPDAPRALSSYGVTLIQTQWEEARWAPGQAAVGMALSFGVEMVVNIVTEFVAQPDDSRNEAQTAR